MPFEKLKLHNRKEALEFEIDSPTLIFRDRDVALEITDKCLAFCPECYTLGRANPEGHHVPYQTLISRLDWLQTHTNCNEITLLGGEPLLHPQFRLLIDEIKNRHLRVGVITGGLINRQGEAKANLDYLIELYAKGDLDFQLSFHPGFNEKAFKDIFDRVRKLAQMRKQSLEDRVKLLTELIDREAANHPKSETLARSRTELEATKAKLETVSFVSTITLTRKYLNDFDGFRKIYRFLFIECPEYTEAGFISTNKDVKQNFDEFVKDQYTNYLKNYLPYVDSQRYEFATTGVWHEYDLHYNFRVWCAVELPQNWLGTRLVTSVIQPRSNPSDKPIVCSATNTYSPTEFREIYLDNILVRTDGEAVFPIPQCNHKLHGFVNLDHDTDPKKIYRKVGEHIARIDRLIHLIDKHHDSARPVPAEGEDCSGCPLDIACNLCYKI